MYWLCQTCGGGVEGSGNDEAIIKTWASDYYLSLVSVHDMIVASEEGGNKMYRFLAIIESGEGLVN